MPLFTLHLFFLVFKKWREKKVKCKQLSARSQLQHTQHTHNTHSTHTHTQSTHNRSGSRRRRHAYRRDRRWDLCGTYTHSKHIHTTTHTHTHPHTHSHACKDTLAKEFACFWLIAATFYISGFFFLYFCFTTWQNSGRHIFACDGFTLAEALFAFSLSLSPSLCLLFYMLQLILSHSDLRFLPYFSLAARFRVYLQTRSSRSHRRSPQTKTHTHTHAVNTQPQRQPQEAPRIQTWQALRFMRHTHAQQTHTYHYTHTHTPAHHQTHIKNG